MYNLLTEVLAFTICLSAVYFITYQLVRMAHHAGRISVYLEQASEASSSMCSTSRRLSNKLEEYNAVRAQRASYNPNTQTMEVSL